MRIPEAVVEAVNRLASLPLVVYYFLMWAASVAVAIPVVLYVRSRLVGFGIIDFGGDPNSWLTRAFAAFGNRAEVWVVVLVALLNLFWIWAVATTREAGEA